MTDSAFQLRIPLGIHVFLFVWALLRVAPGMDADLFEKEIRPLLENHCIKCHGSDKQKGGLRLDSQEAMLRGGENGPVLIPGNPESSRLVQAIRYMDLEMPPDQPLNESQIQAVVRWISLGAEWPESMDLIRTGVFSITDSDRNWWAFRPVGDPSPPLTMNDDRSEHPIDRFIIRKLSEKQLQPAPRADPGVLVRRLFFNLIGLPPSPEEIEHFEMDKSPDAWERLVERLLADPRYGEHWARFWLDLVRYAESDGWNQDAYRPHIWRYRDYVVDAFNSDLSYPEFIQRQLAGDEIEGDAPGNLIATGFLRLGIYEYNQRDAASHWNDIINEMTDVAGDVFLGLGMACARCHNHKFDPIPQTDYFKLRAFFEPVIWRDDLSAATASQRSEYRESLAVWEKETQDVRHRIDKLIQPYHERKWQTTIDKFPLNIQACFRKSEKERTSWEHQMAYLVERQFYEEGGGPLKNLKKADQEIYDSLQNELKEFDAIKPEPLPGVMAVNEFFGPPSPTLIPDRPKVGEIKPGFPVVLSGGDGNPKNSRERMIGSSGRRSALAQWIGDPDNPLTPRVIVNRIWQQHFGKGIVQTPNDFGRMGDSPSHPELLDWLTRHFIRSGWSFKWLHRQILMTATWRQSSQHPHRARNLSIDPDIDLLWSFSVNRLSAEQIRDAMLSAGNEMDYRIGGPSEGILSGRRSLYLKSFRNTPQKFLNQFDAANGLKSVAERIDTTTPLQSLLLFNGTYVLQRASKMADAIHRANLPTSESRIDRVFLLIQGRRPSPEESVFAQKFLQKNERNNPPISENQRLVDFCHVMMNSNAFLYVE